MENIKKKFLGVTEMIANKNAILFFVYEKYLEKKKFPPL